MWLVNDEPAYNWLRYQVSLATDGKTLGSQLAQDAPTLFGRELGVNYGQVDWVELGAELWTYEDLH